MSRPWRQPAGAGKAQRRARGASLGPLTRRLWHIDMTGYDRLPDEGPAILCPNHISFLDSAFLMLTLPRNISFVGKAEYMDSWKTKYLFPAHGHDPDRPLGRREVAVGARRRRPSVLRRGELFGIFPEGTRSRDGQLHKGRTGAARLALEIGCPIYPVGITGTDEIQPPDAKAPKPFRSCSITIGRPVRPERYAEPQRAAPGLAVDDRRGDVRDPRDDRPGVPQPLRRRVARHGDRAGRRRPPGAASPIRCPRSPLERELVGAGA